jgi:hypothetical protein
MSEKQDTMGLLELLRSSWFLIVFVGSLIYWVAKQDSSLSNIQKSESRITLFENRTTILESGIGQLQLKIDGIKEDLNLIKSAVIK